MINRQGCAESYGETILAGIQNSQHQAGEFYGVVDCCDDLRGVRDGFAAEADGRGERRGDEERAFHAVVGVWLVGHEASS